jgi:hypothetical protein
MHQTCSPSTHRHYNDGHVPVIFTLHVSIPSWPTCNNIGLFELTHAIRCPNHSPILLVTLHPHCTPRCDNGPTCINLDLFAQIVGIRATCTNSCHNALTHVTWANMHHAHKQGTNKPIGSTCTDKLRLDMQQLFVVTLHAQCTPGHANGPSCTTLHVFSLIMVCLASHMP